MKDYFGVRKKLYDIVNQMQGKQDVDMGKIDVISSHIEHLYHVAWKIQNLTYNWRDLDPEKYREINDSITLMEKRKADLNSDIKKLNIEKYDSKFKEVLESDLRHLDQLTGIYLGDVYQKIENVVSIGKNNA